MELLAVMVPSFGFSQTSVSVQSSSSSFSQTTVTKSSFTSVFVLYDSPTFVFCVADGCCVLGNRQTVCSVWYDQFWAHQSPILCSTWHDHLCVLCVVDQYWAYQTPILCSAWHDHLVQWCKEIMLPSRTRVTLLEICQNNWQFWPV